jgi:Cof subfamily protein (haloacid dehalogenase superfamily)
MIATDLDGTLLRSDSTLSPGTAAVLERVAAAGVAVVPVTARPVRWHDRHPFTALAPYLTHAVFANGAVGYDFAASSVVTREPLLPPEILAALVARIHAALPQAVFAVETDDGMAMWHEPGYPLRLDAGQPGTAAAPREELVRRPAVKLLVKAPGVDPAKLVDQSYAVVGGDAEPSISSPVGPVELVSPGVTKATGLAAVAARLRIQPTDVVAFGDMPNDLPMLSWAGRAVVVANAHPEVLAIADEVTGSNDEDGVAAWLTGALPRSIN